MSHDRDALLAELLADFRVEAAEHQQALVGGLLALEPETDPVVRAELLERLRREAHSLKGAARVVSLTPLELLCAELENVFAAARSDDSLWHRGLFDVLHRALDVLESCLAELATGQTHLQAAGLSAVLSSFTAIMSGEAAPPPAAPREPEPETNDIGATGPRGSGPATDTVRIATSRLTGLLRRAEELIAVKSALEYYRGQVHELALAPARAPESLAALAFRLEQDQRLLGRMVDELLREMKQTLLLPFSALLDRLPKVVRDLARDQGKDVAVSLQGGEIEVDRRILEQLKDPLIHIVRNSLDHGLETPEVRQRQGKPARGTLAVSVCPTADRQVLLTVSDDGAGIDTERTRAAAVKHGLLTPTAAQQLSEAEALELIWASGLSTSPVVTDLSGRGLGMAIVAEHVSRLGGALSVASERGQGTTLTLRLPLTVAAFRGVVVSVSEHRLVVPTANLERAVLLRPDELATVDNQPTALIDGRVTPVVELSTLLTIPSSAPLAAAGRPRPALLLAAGDRRVAFFVDQVHGEEEGLVKELGPQLRSVRFFAGAIVAGDGGVLPVLHVGDLIEAASHVGERAGAPSSGAATPAQAPQRVLIAEDSVTARTLLRNILEGAGYLVSTAVDGMDALAQLRGGTFDALVSDVEMPRLDGFELTAQLRAEPRLARLPVLLVTALATAADRARGLAVGADAYIVKSSFEQSNLLEVLARLL